MKQYKIVITLEFPHHEEFVVWEPELYGKLCYNNIDVEKLLYDKEKNGYVDDLLSATIELYDDPKVTDIEMKLGDQLQIRQILIGTKILPIRTV
jgi:hypothetical protein